MATVANIRDIIEAGGSVEGDQGAQGTKDLFIAAFGTGDKKIYPSEAAAPKVNVHIALNTDTGNVEITAPKDVTDSDLFKQVFDESTLKEYSAAYKLNPDYKVSVFEKNEETGKEEEKEVTIPEYIDRLNSSLENYMKNLQSLRAYRKVLASQYGDKANNLSDKQVQMSLRSDGKSIYLPDTIFSMSSFGNGKTNFFKTLKDKRAEDGSISLEDLADVYTRDNIGRDEMAALIALIDGSLKGSNWDTEDLGDEAAKLIAFRNYILTNNPHAEWWQQAGDAIESGITNAAYGVTKTFANLADLGETVITAGNGTAIHEAINSMDEAMEYFNTNNALVWDGVANAQILGTLGGYALGTIATAKIGSGIANGISKLSSGLTVKLGAEAAAALGEGAESLTATAASVDTVAKTANTLYQMAMASEEIATGTKIMLASLNLVQKTAFYTNVAITGISGVASKNIVTEYLFDTVHDAILYDYDSLRDVMIELSKDPNATSQAAALRYWEDQFMENAKWWVPMGMAKGAIKTAGKSALGQAANQVLTKYLSKWRAAVGTSVQGVKDNLANGSVVAKLQKQLDALTDQDSPKANRIKTKIDIENDKALLRGALKELGDVKLEWDGIKLTEESAGEFQKFLTKVKGYEDAIDRRLNGVKAVENQMVGLVKDPSTGKTTYINPTLGGANALASTAYTKVAELARKAGLKATSDTLWSTDMVKYFSANQQRNVFSAIAKAGGEDAAKAADALEVLNQNITLAKNRLPEEIVSALDDLLSNKTYQTYYKALNEYGVAHNLLEKSKIASYEANPIWAENGYMPTIVKKDLQGKWVDNSGRIDNIIEQEMDHYTYKVELDQEYVDPELTRLTRQRTMAEAEINKQFWDTYNTPGSTATNIVQISGEETEYATGLKGTMSNLKAQVAAQAAGAFSENNIYEIIKTRRRKPVKNQVVASETLGQITSSLSPSETAEYLASKAGGNVLPSPTAKMTDGVTAENYTDWFDKQNASVQNYLRQQMGAADTAKGSFTELKALVDNGGDDFEAGLERAYLMGDKKFAKSSLANEAARNLADGKDAFYQGVVTTNMKGKLRNVLNVDVDSFVDDVTKSVRGQVDDLVSSVMRTSGVKTAAKTLSGVTDGSDDVARYLVLQEFAKKNNLDAAKKAIYEDLHEKALKANLLTGDEEALKQQVENLVDEVVHKELADATITAKTINPDAVDSKSVYDDVKSLNDRITEAEKKAADKNSDWVVFLDDEGRKSYAQVDPAFASLYKYHYKMSRGEASMLAKANALMSKAFRFGTTSVNLASFGNQLFRDFGNALLVGGAWDTIKHNADNLVDVFGQTIVDQIKAFTPDGYEEKQLQLFAENTGQTLERAAVSRELMRGAALAPGSTETTLYRGLLKRMKGESSDIKLQKMQGKLQGLVDKWSIDNLVNGKRENYLRNRVYASSLNDAMKQGYTLAQARTFAEFAMNNATTNFGRKLYHLQAIADSTPYFSAAINGAKSFWRMWALDPVGISGRVMGGLVLPTMALTGSSLMTEEDKKVYMNIPEYDKANNIVFVFNGNAMSIPIPQELSAIVNPFRQFVEYLNGANENDFWELMANDLLGFSPIELQGFTAIDYNKMISDPTFFDRVSRGFSRVFSQMAPVPVKTTYMLATGTDPYTGKNLRDASYMYYNEETGQVETMTYNENSFAIWVAQFWDDMSPELAEKIVSGVLGTTGSNLLGDITAAIQEGPEAGLLSAGKNIVEQTFKPITVKQYDLVNSLWKQAVRQLTSEKEALLSSEEMKVLNNKLAQTKDPEERQKILAQRQDLVDAFQQKVGDMVKRLESEYNGNFDRTKFAAVIALLNFNSDAGYQSGSQYSSNLANDQFWDGKDAAVHTMQQLGITGTSDISIFGYLTTDKDGNPVVRYTSPVAIMDMANQWGNQKDIHLANIKALASQNDLWDRHEAMEQQISAIYSKGKLSDSDYDAIDAIYVNWNAEVMAALAPYVEKMTPEAAINNSQVIDYLDSLIEVPGDYKKDKYGRYVTNSKLGNGSANAAYIKNYIKNIFKINDTLYSSGKNYSDRQTYVKENYRWI